MATARSQSKPNYKGDNLVAIGKIEFGVNEAGLGKFKEYIGDYQGNEDIHYWVEDKEGNVVYDPYFIEYDVIKCLRNLKGDRIYKRYVGKKGKDAVRRGHRDAVAVAKCLQLVGMKPMKMFYQKPQPLECNMNALGWIKYSGRTDIQLVAGSMGWKRKKGGIHWEFGDGE
jgi:hypothetical protein